MAPEMMGNRVGPRIRLRGVLAPNNDLTVVPTCPFPGWVLGSAADQLPRAIREWLVQNSGEGPKEAAFPAWGSFVLVPLAGKDEIATRRFLQRATSLALERSARRVSIVVPPTDLDEPAALAAIHGASYRFVAFKTKAKATGVLAVNLVIPGDQAAAWRRGRASALAIASGVEVARETSNMPPNVATPSWVAAQARSLSRELVLRCTVWTPPSILKMGLRGLLAVGQGSRNSPRVVRLRYGRSGPRVALVGKGVCFDSGGLSIKPAASMEEMKFDKAGACSVLGTIVAVARAKLPVRLEAFLGLVENLPGGEAYRPSDILKMASGKTVEVLNTDAEGRLVLADLLTLAQRGKPEYLVELSTLTGAAVVALGQSGAALFSPDDSVANGLLRAAARSGERLWRLPLWPEFSADMAGQHGDLKNTGGRWGGACTAAAFLSHFMPGNNQWAHLDIAGPAYTTAPIDGQPPGATGYGVPLLFHWISDLAQPPASP